MPCHDELGERSGVPTEMHRRDDDDEDVDEVGDSGHDDEETMPTAVGIEGPRRVVRRERLASVFIVVVSLWL